MKNCLLIALITLCVWGFATVGCEPEAQPTNHDAEVSGEFQPADHVNDMDSQASLQASKGGWEVRFRGEPGMWIVTYPGDDRMFDTDDDLRLVNAAVFPADRKFKLILESTEVKRGLYISPRGFGVVVDSGQAGVFEWPFMETVGPGQTRVFDLPPLKEQILSMNCHVYCGPEHYKMAGEIFVVKEAGVEAKIQKLSAGK